jgi:putative ABC transport system substrate-binding protein
MNRHTGALSKPLSEIKPMDFCFQLTLRAILTVFSSLNVKQIGLPAMFVLREQAIAGGLMSYSTDLKSAIRASAGQSAEILRGGDPARMPYVQATRFELVINLKTARELGIEMPTALLARADEVIE